MANTLVKWERTATTRRKWYRIFLTYINGVEAEVARFTHPGDVHLYVNRLREGNTVEKIRVY